MAQRCQAREYIVSAGNTDNTFSSNKFYQTATRTQTTGAQHSAIWIANTSGNNFQITGNTIGYASNSGTGTYNFVGFGTTSRFIAIYLNIGSITASSVQGNTITAINISGVTGGTSTTSAFMASVCRPAWRPSAILQATPSAA